MAAAAACLLAGCGPSGAKAYQLHMERSGAAKEAGDMAAVEREVLSALEHGPGDEYAWRTLAWAQGRQGKWQESLENARENIRRSGRSGWSLEQLAESALAAGDFELAHRTLDEADVLSRSVPDGSEDALGSCRRRLAAATQERVYDLHFTVDLKQGGPGHDPVWLLMPLMDSARQRFKFRVRNTAAHHVRHFGVRDYLEVVQRPGEAFFIDGMLVLKPVALGGARLSRVQPMATRSDLKPYLARFQNYSWWDPELPQVQAIAKTVKGRSDAETVQNVLDWFHRNIRYDATIKDDPALGQLGTILKLRYGGCHHNSGLFVTLCRAAGVPACIEHGNALPDDDRPFTHPNPAGHGWAEVFINSLGWVPVEPMDAESLRLFSVSHPYLSVGASNRPPESHHFSETIRDGGREFRVVSIQTCEVRGRRVR